MGNSAKTDLTLYEISSLSGLVYDYLPRINCYICDVEHHHHHLYTCNASIPLGYSIFPPFHYKLRKFGYNLHRKTGNIVDRSRGHCCLKSGSSNPCAIVNVTFNLSVILSGSMTSTTMDFQSE